MDDLLESIIQPPTVEDYLNNVSYNVPPGYIPSEFAVRLVNLIKMINGAEGEANLTPLVHFHMLDTLTTGDRRICNMCHRGAAKTTLMAEYLSFYVAIYNELPGLDNVNLMLYVSDSIENGVKNLRKNLEYRWENSDFLRKYIPTTKFTDIRWEFINADGRHTVIKGYGARTGVRGSKEMGVRPQVAILDDLMSDEDARSPTIIASIEDTIYGAVEYALDNSVNNMMIWSGTPFNAKDPLYKAVESGAWAVNVFPVCEKFPCSEEEFRSSWPDRFLYSYVKKQYDKAVKLGKVRLFDQELMLRIMSDEDRLIPDHEIQWYRLSSILRNKSAYNFYITTDFATSEKQSSDYSVISVWAYNNHGDWFWVDGVCARQAMNKTMDDLFRMVTKWHPQSVGIEVSGQQGAFIPWIKSEMLERNVFFNLASDKPSGEPGIRPNTQKITRLKMVQPWFAAYKMWFPVEMKDTDIMVEFMEEIRLLASSGIRSRNDDMLDTLSMLASLKPFKPAEVAEHVSATENEMWETYVPPDNSGLNNYLC